MMARRERPSRPHGSDGFDGANTTANTISLSLLGRYETGVFDESAAEIVDYDPATRMTFVVNANSGQIDVIDASSPSTPTLSLSLDVAADVAGTLDMDASDLGAANSVAVSNATLAVAIEAANKQANGYLAFYQTDGTFLSAVEAGALPDMVTFTPDGNKVLVANEGEPNGDYSVDPEGSITIVDISAGAGSVTAANVTRLDFTAFNSGGLTGPVRISSKATSVAADLEPEYVGVSADSSTAYVILQKNNAMAVVDLGTNTIQSVMGLGYKNHNIPGNEMDPSNRDNGVNIRIVPVFGTYMPDGADTFEFDGVTYIVTANEEEAREFLTDATDAGDCTSQGGFDFEDGDCFHYLDEVRIKDITDNGASFDPDLVALAGADFEDNEKLGRLKVIANLGTTGACASLATTGLPETDCTYEALYSYGARSFTIWNTQTGQPVFDSGSDFEVITANRLGDSFNASNDDNEGDDRSDDKGPEPEAIEIAVIEGRTYAFIGLERVGGIMVYNITTPEASEFVQYINARDFTVADVEDDLELVGDLGPESIKFVAAQDSPTGNPMLIPGNEVSGTTSYFNIAVITQ
ncbi:choice-of-anchor I family protein [Candidatus Litorirhabdus singularis]|uniref:choice-of-anchor I family protein n=1 Tax=Candidatus Litorirhabdus singularis TaxID=2518993 RepID=UPI00242E3D04|nr:choice-of-anchor I family protein [Candidatus Litorirhabdus singularis]